jgi:tripartite-type tricarboxylate transporter receptor subunit TctC
VRDFTPLVPLVAVPNILVVNPSIPATNLRN